MNVEPAWKPLEPPVARLTLVLPDAGALGVAAVDRHRLDRAGAGLDDVDGGRRAEVSPRKVSAGGTCSSAARCAAACTFGSSVVRIVRPPASSALLALLAGRAERRAQSVVSSTRRT